MERDSSERRLTEVDRKRTGPGGGESLEKANDRQHMYKYRGLRLVQQELRMHI